MYDCSVVIRMRNLALMKATGPKRLPFISIINIFADYTKENNRGNTRLDYIFSYGLHMLIIFMRNHCICQLLDVIVWVTHALTTAIHPCQQFRHLSSFSTCLPFWSYFSVNVHLCFNKML